MTSQINPNNIDGNYPVPGVPNNTQGFRSNFTETRTNFQFAAQEITDLQNKVILKEALNGTTLNNNMNDGLISAVKLNDVSYTYLPVAATAGSIEIDYSAAPYQQITTTGSVSLSFANWPAAGSAGSVRVGFNITNTAHTVTLPAAVSQGITGVQGYVAGTITFATTGIYQFDFSTVDSGVVITMTDLSRPLLGSTASAVGYATGTGGTVTQNTNKSTGVTLNKRCGEITMRNTALGAATIVSFVLTNTTIAPTDVIVINHVSGGTIGAYTINGSCNNGSATIYVRNNTAGSLSEALVLRFVVIKGAVA
jgi:predicted transcriptional regulator